MDGIQDITWVRIILQDWKSKPEKVTAYAYDKSIYL